MLGIMSKRYKCVSFKPLLYYNRELEKTYYYKYFKPYSYDHRLLTMGYDCKCPQRKVHKTNCSWYDTDSIYMIETRADLSISEKAAQQKICKMYLNTINNIPESCGCGTPASIAYMGHSTGCVEFMHLHERESHEVLLAILKSKKNKTFGDDSVRGPKRAKFVPTENTSSHDGDKADTSQAKELSQSSTHAFSMLADIANSDHIPPNNPPNPNSVTDTITVDEAGHLGDEVENEESHLWKILIIEVEEV